ncbi:uncharacterized protein LOC118263337 [Spodoptera frugiperda]|uniref:Uncharacterized protein LOC118263337 n=1 Tax=Spodoptera frugiperda TaxID=7108 RepID=A0A9R0CW30_SPOFR|nr:uncharacterized protein LOC118263337 [Spodoptera frugiperda]XP_050561153.1 uncharacterized protein LOC118263337 [Spodoptera frugiperda]
MACVENIPPHHADSEMEEGEIVDDLSDISSEEEYLLRQRLQVLETYNNVLERKKAKRLTTGPGTKHKREDDDTLLYDLSEISATELDDYYFNAQKKPVKVQKRQKTHHRQKRKKIEPVLVPEKPKEVTREYKKKTHHAKKKLPPKVVSESSEESDDEYRASRRKLADAVVVNKDANKTSLSERLQQMLCGVNPEPRAIVTDTKNSDISSVTENAELSPMSSMNTDDHTTLHSEDTKDTENKTDKSVIDLCSDEDSKSMSIDCSRTVDSVSTEVESQAKVRKDSNSGKESEEDLELLRQHALKTKITKTSTVLNDVQTENKLLSDDEDSDTAELRLICLKSALLKKAIERKQKQKLKKRLSQSSHLGDNIVNDNNTDIESVDMDIGSDSEEKTKENPDGCAKVNNVDEQSKPNLSPALFANIPLPSPLPVVDELEDDEDLLRAKLLTSLSKNLPNLVSPNVIEPIESIKESRPITQKPPQVKPVVPAVVPKEKRFIITVGASDSEGEDEATKNLTKMHMKLAEQADFQQRLDMFLKSTRMEVEKTTQPPDVIQQPVPPKKNEKFVAKAVTHLPKSEQIEYRNLVKRMAELEKIKQARQTPVNLSHKVPIQVKDTLKPRNVATDSTKLTALNDLEEKIKASRKHIAEESAKILKLKDEGLKLSQKYKIVATELRNIKTAIALNKKQTRAVQTCLTKIRLHHQMLLKSSTTSPHSKINGGLPYHTVATKLQKENNPASEENKTHIVNNKLVKTVDNNLSKEEPKHVLVQKPVKENSLRKEEPKINKVVPVEKVADKKEQNRECVVHKVIKETHTSDEPKKPVANNTTRIVKPPPLVIVHPKLSVRLDVTSNKKVVKVGDDASDSNVEHKDRNENLLDNRLVVHQVVEGGGNSEKPALDRRRHESYDYRSPLDAFGITTWQGDPNKILCPFEVGGDCKDPDCKYQHTPSRST